MLTISALGLCVALAAVFLADCWQTVSIRRIDSEVGANQESMFNDAEVTGYTNSSKQVEENKEDDREALNDSRAMSDREDEGGDIESARSSRFQYVSRRK